MLAMLMLMTAGCAPAKPAQPAVEQWVETSVPELGVKFTKPAEWTVVLGMPGVDSSRMTDLQAMSFVGIDDHFTQVGLLRVPAVDPSLTREQNLAETVQSYRKGAKDDGSKVIEDSQRKIAGCPASIFTTENGRTGIDVRFMLIHFNSMQHEYRMNVAGEKGFFDDARSKVMRMVDSMELIE